MSAPEPLPLRVGDLVCLAHQSSEVACRELMAKIVAGSMPSRWAPKWGRAKSGNLTAGYYKARVSVFRNRQGTYTYSVTDGADIEYSRAFARESEAQHAASLSLFAMRETGSFRAEDFAQRISQLRKTLSQYDAPNLPDEYLQAFDVFLWRDPEVESDKAFGWGAPGATQWLPKSFIYPLRNRRFVLLSKKFTRQNGCPLARWDGRTSDDR